MPFIGAAIVPHSPILVSTIGQDYAQQIKQTQRALKAVLSEAYATRPEVLVVIHPHNSPTPESFTASVADKFIVKFTEFGDLITNIDLRCALTTSSRIKVQAEHQRLPLQVSQQIELSYDVAVPITYITPHTTMPSILPITTCQLDRQTHINFGRMLAEALHHWPKRVFVLVSAELSQHASLPAPGGFRPEGEQFDRSIIKSLGKKQWSEKLLQIDPNLIAAAESCGYRPLLVLAGLIAERNVHVKRWSYESPFGIGLLTASISEV